MGILSHDVRTYVRIYVRTYVRTYVTVTLRNVAVSRLRA